MRKYIKLVVLGAVIIASSSCKKFLDVNENPNNPTYSPPNIVLPQAILSAANSIPSYDAFGSWTAGYKANAGGYGGFGSQWTYEYTTGDYATMWSSGFAAINQLNYVINNSDATGQLKYYNAMARVLKSFVYQRLVDQYGDAPYSDAGKGLGKLTPTYDKVSDIYKALYKDLDEAIVILKTPLDAKVSTLVTDAQDPLFGGVADQNNGAANAAKWVRLANTIKLKLLIRVKAKPEYDSWINDVKKSLPTTSSGYLEDDAIVNPGFSSSVASQYNQKWISFAWDNSGTAAGSGLSQIPTPWIISFYDGKKIKDDARGKAIYHQFGLTGLTQKIGLVNVPYNGPLSNQLGNDKDPVLRSVSGSIWYSGNSFPSTARQTGTNANKATNVVGVLKGSTMGMPIFLAAESYFLQAEAALVNLVPGSTNDLFNSGVKASFGYIFKNAAGSYINPKTTAVLLKEYQDANPVNPDATPQNPDISYLVNIDRAPDNDRKLEAIITQKYIAVNFIHSEEGYNEYRRTGFPRIKAGSDALSTFASLKASNNLPARVLYPATEFQVNGANVPKGITTKTKLFYAK